MNYDDLYANVPDRPRDNLPVRHVDDAAETLAFGVESGMSFRVFPT